MDHPADEATVDAIGTPRGERRADNAARTAKFHRRKRRSAKNLWRGGQCDIITGTVIDPRMPRVTPPRMNSRRRGCPLPPLTLKTPPPPAADGQRNPSNPRTAL